MLLRKALIALFCSEDLSAMVLEEPVSAKVFILSIKLIVVLLKISAS